MVVGVGTNLTRAEWTGIYTILAFGWLTLNNCFLTFLARHLELVSYSLCFEGDGWQGARVRLGCPETHRAASHYPTLKAKKILK